MTTKEENKLFRDNNIDRTTNRCLDLVRWLREWKEREADETPHPSERSLLVLSREARGIDVEMQRALISDQDTCDPEVCELTPPKVSFGYHKCLRHNLSWNYVTSPYRGRTASKSGWQKFRFENNK